MRMYDGNEIVGQIVHSSVLRNGREEIVHRFEELQPIGSAENLHPVAICNGELTVYTLAGKIPLARYNGVRNQHPDYSGF